MAQNISDFRSDTITQPTAAMRRAMAEAVVADDGREGDPTAQRLEAKAAALTGHEAALFCTSGTMGNLVAFMTHLRPGEEVIAERDSHCLRYEAGNLAAIVGALPRPLAGRNGRLDLADIETEIQSGSRLQPRTALIALENTHNNAGGTCLNAAYMKALWELASSRGLLVHLDGARVCNAAVALGVPVSALTSGCQSVMLDLSKGLAAPYGSLLCGGKGFIAQARLLRSRIGGNVRQIGHMAAAGIVALETMIDRLAEDHANARKLAEGLQALRPECVQPELVETNIVMVEAGPFGLSGPELEARLEAQGVRSLAVSPTRLRFVTHCDVSQNNVAHALAVFKDISCR
jgi:threonine aldolase